MVKYRFSLVEIDIFLFFLNFFGFGVKIGTNSDTDNTGNNKGGSGYDNYKSKCKG